MTQQDSLTDFSHSGKQTTQVLYRKALKQIDKLVALNNSSKNQIVQWKYSALVYSKLEEEYYDLLSKLNEKRVVQSHLQGDFDHLDIRVNQTLYDSEIRENNKEFSEIKQKVSKRSSINNDMSQIKLEGYSPSKQQIQSQITYYKQQISKYEERMFEKDNIIRSLEESIESKHEQLMRLQEKFGDLNEKMMNIQNQINQKDKIIQNYKNNEESKLKQQQKQDKLNAQANQRLLKQQKKVQLLELKLLKAQDWSKQIQQQYEKMKKSMILSQQTTIVQQIPFAGSLMMPNITHVSRLNTEPDFMHNSNFRSNSKSIGINRRQSMNENDISRIKKQYADKKIKYKNQITKLKQQIDQKSSKIASMQVFIEKQQYYIQNYIYNRGIRDSFINQKYSFIQ